MLAFDVVITGLVAMVLPVRLLPDPTSVEWINGVFLDQKTHNTFLIADAGDLVSGKFEFSFNAGGKGYVAWSLEATTVTAPGASGAVGILETGTDGSIVSELLDPQLAIYRATSGKEHPYNANAENVDERIEIRGGKVVSAGPNPYPTADFCLANPNIKCAGASCLGRSAKYATEVIWSVPVDTLHIARTKGPNKTFDPVFKSTAHVYLSNFPREENECADGTLTHYGHVHRQLLGTNAASLYLPTTGTGIQDRTIKVERCPPPIAYKSK